MNDMKTASVISQAKAFRLVCELTAELQRLEHALNDALPDSACEPTDELENIRAARDSAIDCRDTLELMQS